ncbi:NUDIX domain-containing protein [Paraburkholderia sp. GAS32]|uniref:NUDIX domain-containing protein n=1 Tax=Paraburkholderia sp. GAS32 TaxID=3035129 RepID=UPI003D1A8AF2
MYSRLHLDAFVSSKATVAALIHNHEGKPLLQEKSSGETWSLPAGGNEIGESPQEATIRQVTFRNAPNVGTGTSVSERRVVSYILGTSPPYTSTHQCLLRWLSGRSHLSRHIAGCAY